MAALAWVNGGPATTLASEDRGLLYGDGLFETIAIRQGQPCLWRAHLERLAAGAARLGIPMPPIAQWRAETAAMLAAAGVPASATLKLVLTRGTGARGYAPPAAPCPTRLLLLYPDGPQRPWLRSWEQDGVLVRHCRTRLGINPSLAGLKHLNRLEQVLARAEWPPPGEAPVATRVAEGLMLDAWGNLVCGTMTNLFLVDADGGVRTSDLAHCGVAGTVRDLVLRCADQLGMPVQCCRLRPSALGRARGAFLTNALIGLWPVRRIDDLNLDPQALPPVLAARIRQACFTPEPDW